MPTNRFGINRYWGPGVTSSHRSPPAREEEFREFSVLWLLGTDLPGAVLIQDSEGASLPPEDGGANEKGEQRHERVLRFSLTGVQLKFSAIGSHGIQLKNSRRRARRRPDHQIL
jgi:serine/threonine-protein kinase HipA